MAAKDVIRSGLRVQVTPCMLLINVLNRSPLFEHSPPATYVARIPPSNVLGNCVPAPHLLLGIPRIPAG